MAKHLYYLLTGHGLFNISVYCTQGLLLLPEILPVPSGNGTTCKSHSRDGQNDQQRQDPVCIKHQDKGADNGYNTGKDLRQGIAQHLADYIQIVGEPAHDFAMGMGVMKPQGQPLNLMEQVLPDMVQGTL